MTTRFSKLIATFMSLVGTVGCSGHLDNDSKILTSKDAFLNEHNNFYLKQEVSNNDVVVLIKDMPDSWEGLRRFAEKYSISAEKAERSAYWLKPLLNMRVAVRSEKIIRLLQLGRKELKAVLLDHVESLSFGGYYSDAEIAMIVGVSHDLNIHLDFDLLEGLVEKGSFVIRMAACSAAIGGVGDFAERLIARAIEPSLDIGERWYWAIWMHDNLRRLSGAPKVVVENVVVAMISSDDIRRSNVAVPAAVLLPAVAARSRDIIGKSDISKWPASVRGLIN